MRFKFSAIAMLVALLTVSVGCGGKPITIPSAAPVVAGIDAKVHAAAIKGLGISEALGVVAVDVAVIERRLAAEKVIPAAVHTQAQAAFVALADGALKFNADVASGVIVTWADLTARVDPLIANVQKLIDLLTAFKTSIGSGFDALKTIGIDLLKGLLLPVKTGTLTALEAR